MTTHVTKLGRLRRAPLPGVAVAGGVSGLLAALHPLPPGVRALFLLAFVGAGPGAALVQFWSDSLAPVVRRALVPVVGVSVAICVASLSLLLGYWAPQTTLVGLAAVTILAGAWRARRVEGGTR